MNDPFDSADVGPLYVEHGGEVVARNPYLAEHAQMYNLLVRADTGRLARHLDRCFTEPSGGAVELRPLGPYVVLNLNVTPRLSSESDDRHLGRVPETEVSIWVPAVHGDRIVWAVPYIFVDNGAALSAGREVYGFPKQLARIKVKGPPGGAPSKITLRSMTLARFSAQAVAAEHRVLQATRTTEEPFPLDPGVDHLATLVERQAIDQALKVLRGRLDPVALMAQTGVEIALLHDLLTRRLTMVLLKQFRACDAPERACYQAIVEVDQEITALHGVGQLPDYRVRFTEMDAEPFHRELGLRLDQTTAFACWMNVDFRVELGHLLWQADGA